jgi:hypothetical protein
MLGQYERAIVDYDRAIGLNPYLTWAINSRAKIVARKTRAQD